MAVAQYVRMWFKTSALAANDFASQGFGAGARQGDLAIDTSTGKLYVCSASNVTGGTATWTLVGTQT